MASLTQCERLYVRVLIDTPIRREVKTHMTQLLLLGKFEYTGGPIFKVVLEC